MYVNWDGVGGRPAAVITTAAAFRQWRAHTFGNQV